MYPYAGKKCVPTFILITMSIFKVLRPINFNDQFHLRSIEINNVITKGFLTVKLYAQ